MLPQWRPRLLCLLALMTPIATWGGAWGQVEWKLVSRESGCGSLDVLVRMERLAHAPASPEEFVAMIRPRFPDVTMGLPDGFPLDMMGKVVMVRYAENRAPIFIRAELCGPDGAR